MCLQLCWGGSKDPSTWTFELSTMPEHNYSASAPTKWLNPTPCHNDPEGLRTFLQFRGKTSSLPWIPLETQSWLLMKVMCWHWACPDTCFHMPLISGNVQCVKIKGNDPAESATDVRFIMMVGFVCTSLFPREGLNSFTSSRKVKALGWQSGIKTNQQEQKLRWHQKII